MLSKASQSFCVMQALSIDRGGEPDLVHAMLVTTMIIVASSLHCAGKTASSGQQKDSERCKRRIPQDSSDIGLGHETCCTTAASSTALDTGRSSDGSG